MCWALVWRRSNICVTAPSRVSICARGMQAISRFPSRVPTSPSLRSQRRSVSMIKSNPHSLSSINVTRRTISKMYPLLVEQGRLQRLPVLTIAAHGTLHHGKCSSSRIHFARIPVFILWLDVRNVLNTMMCVPHLCRARNCSTSAIGFSPTLTWLAAL